ncbi:hypothetical protein MPNT_50107 [Candidatus Methylacidithermus pantelleriae]|uniref:Uncharacterized protein n=1 Tax=Candidatus Methylacidithermus pantelleriae TaxID=2744239 RepID=A0A8J2BUX2_9BACT|nr:hypothetical protein MPNT_50107 [Candidatus Methylacidithermus pantelleriae]
MRTPPSKGKKEDTDGPVSDSGLSLSVGLCGRGRVGPQWMAQASLSSCLQRNGANHVWVLSVLGGARQ